MGQAGTQARAGLPRLLAVIGIVAVLALGGGTYLLRARDQAPGTLPVAPTVAMQPAPAAAVPAATVPTPVAAAPVVPPPVTPASPAPVPATTTSAAPLTPASPPPASPAAPAAPSFDVVRVSPQGGAVVAGRAAPGSEVVLLDGSKEIGRAQADRQGSFVVIPAAPLEPGGRSLTLASRSGAGEVRGDGAVMVVVPPSPAPAQAAPPQAAAPAPVAVLVPNAGAPVVLQQDRTAGPVGLDTVDYDDKGGIRFTGHAASGSTLRLYVDNKPVGDAASDATGRWVLAPPDTVAPGVHALRVDRLDASGRVLARVELPFQRAALLAAELAGGRIVVQPGQNLWRMARAAYGTGVRYTVIYLANREQIRDPARIYPGQAFSVPQAAR